jgi:hypothetical protein
MLTFHSYLMLVGKYSHAGDYGNGKYSILLKITL